MLAAMILFKVKLKMKIFFVRKQVGIKKINAKILAMLYNVINSNLLCLKGYINVWNLMSKIRETFLRERKTTILFLWCLINVTLLFRRNFILSHCAE
jgi:hypothetical protein